MTEAEVRQTYSVKEAATMLGISVGKAYQAAREGEIPAIFLGHRIVIPKAAFDELMVAGNAQRLG